MYTLHNRIIDTVRTRTDDECWAWPGTHFAPGGYSKVCVNGKVRTAYRTAYELRYGPVPKGLELDHTCNNKPCWNPDHMEPVTHQVNSAEAGQHNRQKTHCSRGHPYSLENTLWSRKSGRNTLQRQCRACARERAFGRYHSNR